MAEGGTNQTALQTSTTLQMAQWLRVPATLAEDQDQHGSLQQSAILVPGYVMPSCGLLGACINMVSTTAGKHSYTENQNTSLKKIRIRGWGSEVQKTG